MPSIHYGMLSFAVVLHSRLYLVSVDLVCENDNTTGCNCWPVHAFINYFTIGKESGTWVLG